MNKVVEVFIKHSGKNISIFDDVFLRNCIQKRMNELNIQSTEEYINHIEVDISELKSFSDSLFVSYSEFFRQPLTFEILERIILPNLLKKAVEKPQKRLRIWSMACAGGQEAYSLAILLKECSIHLGKEVQFRIFATDYATTELQKAKTGCYNESALKNVSLSRSENWFARNGTTYEVKPELKDSIVFSEFNLLNEYCSCPEESIYGDFDIVFCSNILFYYKPNYQKIIIEKACNCLCKDGYIVTSETERTIFLNNNFVELVPHSAIFQRK